MQIRCNVCSTVVTMGDDVARALAKRGGSVPCRNCKTPMLVRLAAASIARDPGDFPQPVAAAPKAPAPSGAAQGPARATAANAAPGARVSGPNPAPATARAPGAHASPAAARTTAPTAAQAAARVAARTAPARAGDVPAPQHGAQPGVAASRTARHTLPFGPSPAAMRPPTALNEPAARAPAPPPAARAPLPSTTGRETGGARSPGAVGAARGPMPSVSGAPHRATAAAANQSGEPARAVAQAAVKPAASQAATAEPSAAPRRVAPPPPRSSVTDTPAGVEGKPADRISHRPIPPLPGSGPERLRAWVRQQADPGAKPRPVEPQPAAPRRSPPERAPAVDLRSAAEHRPALGSRAFLEREAIEDEDDDDRPTRRPPPVAELAKGVFDTTKAEVERAHHNPVNAEPEFISVAPDPPDDEAELEGSSSDDELPTLPPTPPDPEDDGDDEPTIVEPYSFFATRNLSIEDRPSDERPTDRSIPVATPVPADRPPPPATPPARQENEPRRAAEAPPPPRVGTVRDRGLAPIGYPGAAAPAVRVMGVDAPAAPPSVPPAGAGSISAVAMSNQHGLAASMMSRAATSAPPVAPVLSSQLFRAARRTSDRSKATNIAAAVAALVVIAAAGYLGAMSGKRIEAAPDPVPSEPSATAKVETPPPPEATVKPHHDPPAAPPPAVEALAPSHTREPNPEPPPPPPPPREVVRESPPPRRTTTDEETPRPRESTRTKSRTPRPPADEEGSSGGPPETRLPDPSEAPAARATIDQAALRAAFAEGEAKAKSCLGATSPTGTARISVTFAPTGEAVGAFVSGAPFANTLEGQCMAAKFRTLHVPPFTGAEVIVRKSISFL